MDKDIKIFKGTLTFRRGKEVHSDKLFRAFLKAIDAHIIKSFNMDDYTLHLMPELESSPLPFISRRYFYEDDKRVPLANEEIEFYSHSTVDYKEVFKNIHKVIIPETTVDSAEMLDGLSIDFDFFELKYESGVYWSSLNKATSRLIINPVNDAEVITEYVEHEYEEIDASPSNINKYTDIYVVDTRYPADTFELLALASDMRNDPAKYPELGNISNSLYSLAVLFDTYEYTTDDLYDYLSGRGIVGRALIGRIESLEFIEEHAKSIIKDLLSVGFE